MDNAAPQTVIRLANSDEVAIMQALELDAAKSYAPLPGYGFSVVLAARSDEEHAKVRATGAGFVAETAGRITGFILVLPLDGDAHIFEAAVAADMQGRGVGSRLLDTAEAYARAHQYQRMTLTTYRDVPWNAPFYRRRGYEIFTPDASRPQMLALIEDEIAQGYTQAPRVAMIKTL